MTGTYLSALVETDNDRYELNEYNTTRIVVVLVRHPKGNRYKLKYVEWMEHLHIFISTHTYINTLTGTTYVYNKSVNLLYTYVCS